MWKMMKNVNVGEPTSFLDHPYLGCNQLECKPNETIFEHYTKMFESRISLGAKENWARANCGVILRHGGTRSKMRRAMLRIAKQERGVIGQNFKPLLG